MEQVQTKITWYDLLLLFLGRYKRYRVTGHSMEPTLQPGDEVLTRPFHLFQPVAQGTIVIAKHPKSPETTFIKRVDQILDDGSFILLGDNLSQSSDSRSYGPFRPEWIRAIVVKKFE